MATFGQSAPPVIPSTPVSIPAGSSIDNAIPTSPSIWDRISTYASEHKAVVYTIGAIAVVVTAGGVYYYNTRPDTSVEKKRPSKKERRLRKQKEKEAEAKTRKEQPTKGDKDEASKTDPKGPSVADVKEADELPEFSEELIETLTPEEKIKFAQKLKGLGNKAYGSKDYNKAIALYTDAIRLKPDPIYYSNRSACHFALAEWQDVVDDSTAALTLDPEYVKALNRRAHAYEELGQNSDALLDYTASCILDSFRNDTSTQSVERLLKKVATEKGQKMLEGKEKKLPSATFVTNYMQSFRPKSRPEGLEDTAVLEDGSGDWYLRAGLQASRRRTGDGYEEASQSFIKALELGVSDIYKHVAYNMRGTYSYLRGESTSAVEDLTSAIDASPQYVQSYVKRASMNLELGMADGAMGDFEKAIEIEPEDPDIYYHRAQLHFISGEFPEAAKDYQKSIDLDKGFIFSHIQLGVTQYKMGSVASSMATFRKCVKRFEKTPDVYNYYGELLLDQQKYAEAVEKFDLAVEMEKQQRTGQSKSKSDHVDAETNGSDSNGDVGSGMQGMNVLPLINKALAIFQWKQDFAEAEKLCKKALIIDPECDIAVATMAQLLLQQHRVTEALDYFERAAELSRTEGEIVNALSYAEATRTQLEVQRKYPKLASRLGEMAQMAAAGAGVR